MPDPAPDAVPPVRVAVLLKAVGLLIVVTAVRHLLDPVLGITYPYLLFLFPTLYIANAAGWRAGALFLLFGMLIGSFLFTEPRFSFWVDSSANRIGMALYLAVGGACVYMAHARFKAHALAEANTRALAGEAVSHRRRLAAIVESTDDAIISKDLNGTIQTWNEGATRIFGYSLEEAVGRPITMLIPAALRDEEMTIVERLRRGEQIDHIETVRITKEGRRIDVSLTISPLRDERGAVVGASKIVRNISERKAAQKALAERERLLRVVTGSIRIGLVVVNERYEYLFANDAYAEIFQFDPNGIVGRRVPDLLPFAWSHIQPRFDRAIAGERMTYELCVPPLRGEAEPRWMRVMYEPSTGHHSQRTVTVVVIEITDQKRSEAERMRSANLLKAVADGTPDAVFVKDREGKYLMINAAAAGFMGRTVDEILGKQDDEFFDPEGVRVIVGHDQAVMETGNSVTEEETVTVAGVTRTFDSTKAPYRDAGGNILGVIGVSRDITQRKLMENDLRQSQGLLSKAGRLARTGAWAVELSNQFVTWSRELRELHGFPEGYQPGVEEGLDLYPPEYRPIVADAFHTCAATGEPFDIEVETNTYRGERLWARVIGEAERNAHGAIVRVQGALQDISERKRNEEALLLRDRAVQAASQGILITDPNQPNNPIIYVSAGFERLTGYPPEEALGNNCRFLQGPKTDPAALQKLRNALKAGQGCKVELLNYRKDGSTFWNGLSVSPVRDSAGRVTHYIGVQTDITERKMMEEQYRQAQKMEAFGQLAGGVAHDFNNLLTIINGFSEFLLGAKDESDPDREALEAIANAGERAAGLTSQLLAFSRQTVLEPMDLDPNAVVTETTKMLRRLIGEDVRLTASLDPRVSRVRVDPGQLGQVLMNLAVNARDAMPTGGKLTIETQTVHLDAASIRGREVLPGRYVMIGVTDTGTGMAPEVKARVFEPFFTTKGMGHGTGLGLATVYGIIKQSGGHVEVYSELGIGTSFKIYLPALESVEATPAPKDTRPKVNGGSETVVLVEDQPEVRHLAALSLETFGYKVIEAGDGADILERIERERPHLDILVTDVVMPGMSGRQVAEGLRALYPGLKVLYTSGYTDDAVVRHGILQADVSFLRKPYTPFSLARKVREVLDQE